MLGTLVCTYLGINWAEQMFHTSMLTGGVFYIMLFLIFLRCFKIIDLEQIQSIRRHVVYG